MTRKIVNKIGVHNSNQLKDFVEMLNTVMGYDPSAKILNIEYVNGYWHGFIDVDKTICDKYKLDSVYI